MNERFPVEPPLRQHLYFLQSVQEKGKTTVAGRLDFNRHVPGGGEPRQFPCRTKSWKGSTAMWHILYPRFYNMEQCRRCKYLGITRSCVYTSRDKRGLRRWTESFWLSDWIGSFIHSKTKLRKHIDEGASVSCVVVVTNSSVASPCDLSVYLAQ